MVIVTVHSTQPVLCLKTKAKGKGSITIQHQHDPHQNLSPSP
jgi:hypothetical protein